MLVKIFMARLYTVILLCITPMYVLAVPLEFVSFQATSQYYPSINITEEAGLLNKGGGSLNITAVPSAANIGVRGNLSAVNLSSAGDVIFGDYLSSKNKGQLTFTGISGSAANLKTVEAAVKNLYIYTKFLPVPENKMSWQELTLTVKDFSGNSGPNNSQLKGKFLKIGESASVFDCKVTQKDVPNSTCTLKTSDNLYTNPVTFFMLYGITWDCTSPAKTDFVVSDDPWTALAAQEGKDFNYDDPNSGWKESFKTLSQGKPAVFYDIYGKSVTPPKYRISNSCFITSSCPTGSATFGIKPEGSDSYATALQKARNWASAQTGLCPAQAGQMFDCAEIDVTKINNTYNDCIIAKRMEKWREYGQAVCKTLAESGKNQCNYVNIGFSGGWSGSTWKGGRMTATITPMICTELQESHYTEITCK